jgi:hypothetical protein
LFSFPFEKSINVSHEQVQTTCQAAAVSLYRSFTFCEYAFIVDINPFQIFKSLLTGTIILFIYCYSYGRFLSSEWNWRTIRIVEGGSCLQLIISNIPAFAWRNWWTGNISKNSRSSCREMNAGSPQCGWRVVRGVVWMYLTTAFDGFVLACVYSSRTPESHI